MKNRLRQVPVDDRVRVHRLNSCEGIPTSCVLTAERVRPQLGVDVTGTTSIFSIENLHPSDAKVCPCRLLQLSDGPVSDD